jgi:hypothetical protein
VRGHFATRVDTGLLAAMEEDDDHLTLYRASAPIPDLPEVAVDSTP